MRNLAFLGLLVAFGLMSAAPSLAQPDVDVWGAKGQYCRMYDPRTVETVTGEVSEVRNFTPPGKGASGRRFTLITKQGPIEAILGPNWYVEKQNFVISPHDQLTVKGSKVAVESKPTLIVTEVTKAGKTWKLRHKTGMPVWAPESGSETSG
jgi:hypothetical protein